MGERKERNMAKAKTREELLEMYDDVDVFYGGLARAKKDNRWLHIRPDGTPAYKGRYSYVGDFREELAVINENSEWFHIQPDGTPAYEERFECVGPFREGLARVWKDNERFDIRPDGKRVG